METKNAIANENEKIFKSIRTKYVSHVMQAQQ